MAKDRSEGRDVHFLMRDTQMTHSVVSFWIPQSLTQNSFKCLTSSLSRLIPTMYPWEVRQESTLHVAMNRSNLETMISSWNQRKVTYIYFSRISQIPNKTGTLSITDEVPVTRITSHTVTGRDNTFRAAVRERDKKCVITGLTNSVKNMARNEWDRFEAAYVFPLACESLFIHGNLPRWITLRAPTKSGINSVQNALLLRVDVHRLFDQYLITINPDVCIFRRPFRTKYVVLI